MQRDRAAGPAERSRHDREGADRERARHRAARPGRGHGRRPHPARPRSADLGLDGACRRAARRRLGALRHRRRRRGHDRGLRRLDRRRRAGGGGRPRCTGASTRARSPPGPHTALFWARDMAGNRSELAVAVRARRHGADGRALRPAATRSRSTVTDAESRTRQPRRADRRRDRSAARAAHAAADVRRRQRACAHRRAGAGARPGARARAGVRRGRAPVRRRLGGAGARAAMRRTRRDALGRRLARSLLPPAVVLDVSFVNGLEAIRSLAAAGRARDRGRPPAGRARLPLAPRAPRRSRPTRRTRRPTSPSWPSSPSATSRSRPSCFPTHDAPLAAVARNAERLAAYQLPGSGWDVLEPLQQQAPPVRRRRGAPASACRCTFAADSEAEARARGGGAPLPGRRQAGRSDPVQAALRAAGARLRRRRRSCSRPGDSAADCEPLLQEVDPGRRRDALDGRLVHGRLRAPRSALFCGRKLVQMPRGFGTCRVGEARWRDDVVEQALALLDALGYHGIAQTEFRLDPRDGALQADGGQPAPLAVARPGACLRRRPAAHRLRRRARPPAAPRALAAASTTAAAGSSRRRTCARRAQEGTPLRRALREIGPGARRGHVRPARPAARDRAGQRPRHGADRARAAPRGAGAGA